MTEIKLAKSEPVQPADKSWLEHLQKTEQEIPNRLEDAAKFLATMISVSFSFFAGTYKPLFLGITDIKIKGVVAFWLLALVFSFLVLYPFRYDVFSESADSIRKMHRSIVVRKRLFLILSIIFFLFALMLLSFVFFF